MKYTQKPGETPAFTGTYQEINVGGEGLEKPNYCTIEAGDSRLPPTRHARNAWLWISPVIEK